MQAKPSVATAGSTPASPALPALSVAHLSKYYGAQCALNKLSFSLPQGACLCIFGPNGAGKTTLLRLLAGMETPNEGDVWVEGLSVREQARSVHARIGVLAHEPMLYPDLSIEENLRFFAQLYPALQAEEKESSQLHAKKHSKKEIDKQVNSVMEALQLKGRRYDTVASLSQGTRQRVAIARAFVHNPSLLLLDEPFAGLDRKASVRLRTLLGVSSVSHGACSQTRTIVMTSHDTEGSFEYATHVMILSKGHMVFFGEKEAVFSRMQALGTPNFSTYYEVVLEEAAKRGRR